MNTMSRQVRRQIARSATGRLPVAGFTPIASQRFASLVSRKLWRIADEMANKPYHVLVALGLPTNMGEAQEEAQRRAARDLPAPRMVRSHRIKPSKSDKAAYRKSKGPDLVFA